MDKNQGQQNNQPATNREETDQTNNQSPDGLDPSSQINPPESEVLSNKQSNNQSDPQPKSKYGKRPFWQWLLIYAVVGGLLYLIVWMLFFTEDGLY